MRRLILVLTISMIPANAFAQVDNVPWSAENSDISQENSSLNYNNSPLNPKNSGFGGSEDRSVYDNDGNRIGYAVPKANGGVNMFDNDGNRIGYSPGRR